MKTMLALWFRAICRIHAEEAAKPKIVPVVEKQPIRQQSKDLFFKGHFDELTKLAKRYRGPGEVLSAPRCFSFAPSSACPGRRLFHKPSSPSKFLAILAMFSFAVGLAGSLEAEGVLERVTGSHDHSSADTVLVSRADLDGDGNGEWFVSVPSRADGKAGLLWQGFREGRSGLVPIGDATFHRQAVVGESEAGWGIHSLWPAGAGRASAIRHHLTGGRMQMEKVAEVITGDESGGLPEPWRSFLGGEGMVIEEIPRDELYERFPALAKILSGEGGPSGATDRHSGPGRSGPDSFPMNEVAVTTYGTAATRWAVWVALGILTLALGYRQLKSRA